MLFICIFLLFGQKKKVSAEGYEPYEEPFEVMGDEATVLNVTLRRLAVSLSSTSSSPTLVPLGTVEDALITGSTTVSIPTDDDFSGDGNHNTQHPNGVNPNNSITTITSVTMATLILEAATSNNETTSNDLPPTNPNAAVTGSASNIGSNEEDDDEDDGDEDNAPSNNNPDGLEPRAGAVTSAASSGGGGGGITMRLCLTIAACTFIMKQFY